MPHYTTLYHTIPPYTPLYHTILHYTVAAGFFFAPAGFLKEVPFDPFLPWIFMGEEISMSARMWTSGYDIFSPTINVLNHYYVRRHYPKVCMGAVLLVSMSSCLFSLFSRLLSPLSSPLDTKIALQSLCDSFPIAFRLLCDCFSLALRVLCDSFTIALRLLCG